MPIPCEPKIKVDTKTRTPTSLEPFINGLVDFDLKAGQSKDVKFSIDIPTDTAAGGYFGAVRFIAVPKGQQNVSDQQVALNASIASLVLAEVEGDITEQIQVNSVKVLRDNRASTFFTSAPNRLAVDIQNKGNGFAKPFGRVQINGITGKEVFSYEINNKDPRGNVLPRSSRTFTDGIGGIKLPGRYSAVVNVSYGTGGEIITQKISFWYVPFWVFLALLALILLIGGGGYLLYRRRGYSPRRRR